MKSFLLLLVAAVVALVAGNDAPVAYKTEEYKVDESYDGFSKLLYRGMYSGKCVEDGFYYKSEYSFMMCSNGKSYEQRCAYGSRNSGYKNYKDGAAYYLHDFCDENMVDHGKKPQSKGYNEVPKPDGYEVKPVVTPRKVEVTYETEKTAYVKPVVPKHGYAAFHGLYYGKCGADGFYYNNDDSFVICSNGVGYVQRCAPGSRNSGYGQYNKGASYASRDFCDVNLVDYGYAAYPGKSGYYQNARFVPPAGFGFY